MYTSQIETASYLMHFNYINFYNYKIKFKIQTL
jgi:hypothetical protein